VADEQLGGAQSPTDRGEGPSLLPWHILDGSSAPYVKELLADLIPYCTVVIWERTFRNGWCRICLNSALMSYFLTV
jgi:hypothetical protein